MLRKSHIYNWLLLLPIIVVFVSEIFLKIDQNISTILKVGALVTMFVLSLVHLKFTKHLVIGFFSISVFFVYGFLISFNSKAAIAEFIRYLFPIVTLAYGYVLRRKFNLILAFLIVFTLLNDIYQIFNYIDWFKGKTQWFYHYAPDGSRYYNASSGILRATGFVVFFGLFGYLNLITYILVERFYKGRFKKALSIVFIISILLSFSYKTIGALLVIVFLRVKHKDRYIMGLIGAITLFSLISPKVFDSVSQGLVRRVEQYITEGDSARSESYRVMFLKFGELNLFGEGMGSFGGPASIEHKSPLYEEVKFNWYKTPNLKTTDTFFPHLFVELGMIGGIVYLLVIFLPVWILKWPSDKRNVVLAISFSFLFDSIFSFSLNNLAFNVLTMILFYPLFYFNDKNKTYETG